ncbi:uncharacterized protein EV420DRAFT_1634600 [Desarmillaria tabescens]|uniref:Uncharacterized protein n=1 Tax=Armillaria tabescens TaxID=1929756 RepID=A0AA39NQY1_ARMTA|nr:uncharacterized protein EV420DRAFT_1634600 [Desarmillaria tabescens]KAK0470185.1 hypothetical protein EV420DRAFT_1634600 [Desarmillaria tabescens]
MANGYQIHNQFVVKGSIDSMTETKQACTGDMIEALINERTAKDKLHLSWVMKEHNVIKSASIKRDEDAGMWRIIRKTAGEGAIEEVVFTMTGAIYAMDLPPVTKETSHGQDAKRESEIPKPNESANDGREFREGEMEEWKPTKVKNLDVVELSNRYFRPRNNSNEEDIPFSPDVDLMGILVKIAQ